jgi:hypothetical protein
VPPLQMSAEGERGEEEEGRILDMGATFLRVIGVVPDGLLQPSASMLAGRGSETGPELTRGAPLASFLQPADHAG